MRNESAELETLRFHSMRQALDYVVWTALEGTICHVNYIPVC
jgi:hypothetical protein